MIFNCICILRFVNLLVFYDLQMYFIICICILKFVFAFYDLYLYL